MLCSVINGIDWTLTQNNFCFHIANHFCYIKKNASLLINRSRWFSRFRCFNESPLRPHTKPPNYQIMTPPNQMNWQSLPNRPPRSKRHSIDQLMSKTNLNNAALRKPRPMLLFRPLIFAGRYEQANRGSSPQWRLVTLLVCVTMGYLPMSFIAESK